MSENKNETKLATPIYTRNANKRYYEKKKQNPEFMENQRAKAREKYQKKKNMLNNLEFQILI
jgi:hypothetical protein